MDPFDRQIVNALEKKRFDPQKFEACMGDLLRDDIPGLVPVPGGSDAGMDGAIADGRGEPYPLVCTTAKDVERNLDQSLDSYKRREAPRQLVGLATSQVLTPRRRRGLEKRARDKGFTMVQIFDQRAIADRLYYNSRWRRDLLNLTCRPGALSRIPKTRRPLLDAELVGRDADVHWLETTAGNRLLYGQPGSGKTYLACYLARQGRALFLTSTDETHVAEALLEQRPEVIIVDDAHRNREQLELLRHLQQRGIREGFSILAISWEGDKDRVAEALGTVSKDQMRHLELLSFRDIVEVIRQAGIQGPDELLRVLANQAANKPGLAVTLALLCLQGDWERVVQGEALRTTLMPLFEDLVGRAATPFLAAVSLGGGRGMPLSAVEGALGLRSVETWQMANDLAAGGVLVEIERNVLAVWPSDLRSALLRHVYFGGSSVGSDYLKLLEQAPSFPHAVQAVLAAVHRGADVPVQELRELVLRSGPTEIVPGLSSPDGVEVWRTYAALGEEEARWALEHYPRDPIDVVRQVLWSSPQLAISKILDLVVDATGSFHSHRSRPLSILKGWIEEMDGPPEQPIERRQLFVRQIKVYLKRGGDRGVGIQAFFIALSPRLSGSSRDVMGQMITLRSALLPLEQLRRMSIVWEEIYEELNTTDVDIWPHLTDALWDWIYPRCGRGSPDVLEQYENVTHSFAARVLQDLAHKVKPSPGIAAGLVRLARRLNVELPLDLDPVFELLYPEESVEPEDEKLRDAAARTAIRDLAARWIEKLSPSEMAETLARYESEADRIGHMRLPPRAQELCGAIAAEIANAAPWLEALIDVGAQGPLIRPFLERAVNLRHEGWERSVMRCLHVDGLTPMAAIMLLESSCPLGELWDLAFAKAAAQPLLVEELCFRNQIPLSTLKALLLHQDWKVAVAAAVGSWLTHPKGKIRETVPEEWQTAILSTSGDEKGLESQGLQYWVGEIIGSDPDLAFAWIRGLLRENSWQPQRFKSGTIADRALDTLEDRHRLEILDLIGESEGDDHLLVGLIGKSVAAYRRLLEIDHLREFHLKPLASSPDSLSSEMMQLALAEGYEPREVAMAAFEEFFCSSGHGQQYWRPWVQAFEALASDPDRNLQEVARHGHEFAQKQIDEADKMQRQAELRPVS